MQITSQRDQWPLRCAARGPVPWGPPESGDFDDRDDNLDAMDWSPTPAQPEMTHLHHTPRVWYHVSPHELPVGTVLTPHGGQGPWTDLEQLGLKNRTNHVWVTQHPDQWATKEWRGDSPAYLYRVQPKSDPRPWNNTGQWGWVTPEATITHALGPYNRTKIEWNDEADQPLYQPKRQYKPRRKDPNATP